MYTLIENQEGEMFAISADRIKRFPMADSYGDYGQECGSYTAGDWLIIETQEAADQVNAWWKENEESEKVWAVGDSISAYDSTDLFDQFTEEEGFELNQLEVTGFNYHDGHNWASIIVDMDNGEEAPYSYCDDDLIKKFNAQFESKEQTKQTSFGTTYETESFILFDGNSHGDWAAYDVNLKPEITRQDIIAALQQYDESVIGETFEGKSFDQLWKQLEEVAEETEFTAEELIKAVTQGF